VLDGIPFSLDRVLRGRAQCLAPKGVDTNSARWSIVCTCRAAIRWLIATTTIDVGSNARSKIIVREWQGPIGQWDSRLKEPRQLQEVLVAR